MLSAILANLLLRVGARIVRMRFQARRVQVDELLFVQLWDI
nr:hypothetical protein [uncultured Sphingomonas sp.]